MDNEDVASPWTSVTLPDSSVSYDITGLRFNAEYEIWLRAEAEEAHPDCDQEETGRAGPCGPWAKTSGNTGGANRPPVAVEELEAILVDQAFAAGHGVSLPHPADRLRSDPEPQLAAGRVELGPEPEGLPVGFPSGLARRQRPRAAGPVLMVTRESPQPVFTSRNPENSRPTEQVQS